jgi:asparagine synthase (glutamine-hydrolysing)
MRRPSLRRLVRRVAARRRYPPIVRAVRRDRLTYLDEDALTDLYEAVQRLEAAGAEGALVEAGCALGGSAIVLAAAKAPARPLYVYDVFGIIPAPSAHDEADVHARYADIAAGRSRGIGGDRYYGYEEGLLEKVRAHFVRHGLPPEAHAVHLVRGLFQDTLHPPGPVALAHVDGDWYESVMTCLERIAPRLVPGGVLVIDDYDRWSGCRKAVDAYFAGKEEAFAFVRRERLHVVRKGA